MENISPRLKRYLRMLGTTYQQLMDGAPKEEIEDFDRIILAKEKSKLNLEGLLRTVKNIGMEERVYSIINQRVKMSMLKLGLGVLLFGSSMLLTSVYKKDEPLFNVSNVITFAAMGFSFIVYVNEIVWRRYIFNHLNKIKVDQ
jgi:hypothetical protein